MKAKQSLKAAELQDGDIICFQLAPPEQVSDNESLKSGSPSISGTTLTPRTNSDRIEDARMFYDFLVHKREVIFAPHPTRCLNAEQYQAFNITLSSKMNYDSVASKVGDYLGVDPTHIRFWTVNATTNNPKSSVKRGQGQILQTILSPPYSTFSNSNQKNNALFFEVLDISLSELDTKKPLKVLWLSDGISKVVC